MTIVILEIYNLILLIFMVGDYILKYKNKLTSNSYIWFQYCFSVTCLSMTNIIIFFNKSEMTQLFWVKLGYYIMILPMIIMVYYIDVNYFDNKNIKRKKLHYTMYFLLFLAFTHIFFIFTEEPNMIFEKITDYHNYNSLIVLGTLPYVLMLGIKWTKNQMINRSVLFSFILMMSGIIVSYLSNELPLTLILTVGALNMYSIKYNKTINNDHLTGAYNRRFLDTMNFSNNKLYCMLIIDVDKFKYINDNYGHDAGDKILIEIVDLLNLSIRNNDVVIRTGGDEFLVIANIKHKKDIDLLKNRINVIIGKRNKGKEIKISVSIGGGIYHPTEDFMEAYKKIDALMYEEKKKNHEKESKTKNIA